MKDYAVQLRNPPPPLDVQSAMAVQTLGEQLVGFPWSQILIIALVRVAEPVAFTSLFTYVYFMVRDFGIAKNEADVAKYAGYLSSCFAFAQVFSSYNWGRFADRHGRKPTILIGLCGSSVSLLLLGFSKNYWWALGSRTLMGLLNGNIGAIRTMIGETATEKKHQSLAFAATPLAYQVGASIGPLLGGYLVSLEKTPFKFVNDLKEKHPYALPNIVVSLFLFFSFLVALFFMEETHIEHKYRRDWFVEMGDTLQISVGIIPKSRMWQEKLARDVEEPLLGSSSSDSFYGDDDSTKPAASFSTEVDVAEEEEQETGTKQWSDIISPTLLLALSSNIVMGLHSVVYMEFFPIFLSHSVIRDKFGHLVSRFPFKIVGGLSYTADNTGRVLSLSGLFGIFFVLVVLPQLTRKYEPMQIYTSFVLLTPVIYFVVPWVVLLADHITVARTVVYTISACKTLTTTMCFPQLLVTINNLSPPRYRAQINGSLISVQAAGRCLGPMVWGYFMSWGQKYEIAWLSWWLCSGLALVTVLQSRRLRTAVEAA